MLDVETRSPVRPAGAAPGIAAWVEERRPLVVAGAFAVAVLLGVLIGLATAPSKPKASGLSSSEQVIAPELRPPLPAVSWDGSRQPGRAHQVKVDPSGGVRLALQFAVAAQLRKAAGEGVTLPTAADVRIPEGMYYGAIEGVDAAHDEFWAVGETEVAGVAQQPADPYVWRRIGNGAWEIVGSGPGSCAALPGALSGPEAWKGRPRQCTSA
jgi:hypothetical protein